MLVLCVTSHQAVAVAYVMLGSTFGFLLQLFSSSNMTHISIKNILGIIDV